MKNAWSHTSTPKYAFMAWCSIKHRDSYTCLSLWWEEVAPLSVLVHIMIIMRLMLAVLLAICGLNYAKYRCPFCHAP
jgi:hypothetical protein